MTPNEYPKEIPMRIVNFLPDGSSQVIYGNFIPNKNVVGGGGTPWNPKQLGLPNPNPQSNVKHITMTDDELIDAHETKRIFKLYGFVDK